MNKQQINEAMATLDGINLTASVYLHSIDEKICYREKYGSIIYIPDYTTDHNAVQRVIDGLDEIEMQSYIDQITWDSWEACMPDVLRLTALQKCEAILRAKGLWIEEDAE